MFTVAGESPRTQVAAPVDAVGVVGRSPGRPGDATNGITAEHRTSPLTAGDRSSPRPASPGLRLLARVGVVDPTSLDDYRANGGFRALERARAIGAAGRSSRR